MFKWKPPTVGEPTENHIEVWTVAVGNLPIFPTKASRDLIKTAKSLDGFVGIYPMYPHGTLLLFDSENNAKGGRNILRFKGHKCGSNIATCYVEKAK